METMHSYNQDKLFCQWILQGDPERSVLRHRSIFSRNSQGLWQLVSRLLGIQRVIRKQDTNSLETWWSPPMWRFIISTQVMDLGTPLESICLWEALLSSSASMRAVGNCNRLWILLASFTHMYQISSASPGVVQRPLSSERLISWKLLWPRFGGQNNEGKMQIVLPSRCHLDNLNSSGLICRLWFLLKLLWSPLRKRWLSF